MKKKMKKNVKLGTFAAVSTQRTCISSKALKAPARINDAIFKKCYNFSIFCSKKNKFFRKLKKIENKM